MNHTKISSFNEVPNLTFAMKLSPKALSAYKSHEFLSYIAVPKKGLISSDNNRFLRLWYEVDIQRVQFGLNSIAKQDPQTRWVPHNKGGSFRRWYGNQDYLISWELNGLEVKGYAAKLCGSYSRQIMNEKHYFLPSISWSSISSQKIGVRIYPNGFVFDTAGPSLFINDQKMQTYIFGLLGSCVAEYFIKATNPTISLLASDISNLPLRYHEQDAIFDILPRNVQISKNDWDSYETSWNFKRNPLV